MKDTGKIYLFDLANTLLYKPSFYDRFIEILEREGIAIPLSDFIAKHRWLSEIILFPDKTSREFYQEFNAKLLLSIGVQPKQQLLDDIFAACTYLPWQPFADTHVLGDLQNPKAILSNWDESVKEKVESFFPNQFAAVFGSALSGVRKPDVAFFQKAIDELNASPNEITYVGDSLKLDIFPALDLGINAILIDRNNDYPLYRGKKIHSLEELIKVCD
jgi:putative hydrolase of the HAD superfamily